MPGAGGLTRNANDRGRRARRGLPARRRRDRDRARRLRRLRRHPRRPRRASRRRHPAGRRLSEKVRHLRQHRGARADGGARRRFRPARRARTGRSCARCRTCSATTPALRLARAIAPGAVQGASPSAAHRPDRARRSRPTSQALAALGGTPDKAPFGSAVDDFYLTNRDRARVRPIMAECSVLAEDTPRADSGGVERRMAEFWTNYIWPLIVMVAQSVLLLVVLLVDHAPSCSMPTARSGRRCRSGAARTWSVPGACCSRSPTCIKFVVKEPIIPSGANKGVFLLAPLVTAVLALSAWAVIPVDAELGDRRHQCRHPLYLRDLLARRLRHHHGGLGVELEISVPRARCARPRRWCPTRSRSASCIITVLLCVGSLNLSAIVDAQDGQLAACSAGSGCRCSRCS